MGVLVVLVAFSVTFLLLMRFVCVSWIIISFPYQYEKNIQVDFERKNKYSLLGHGSSLQERTSCPTPLQFRPPNRGGGLVQVRNRLCVPPAHVTLHSSQSPQSVHFPSTVEQMNPPLWYVCLNLWMNHAETTTPNTEYYTKCIQAACYWWPGGIAVYLNQLHSQSKTPITHTRTA